MSRPTVRKRLLKKENRMISRRDWLGTTLGAGATLALTPELLRALRVLDQQKGKLIQRAIPSTGEMLPVISFGPRPTAPAAPGPTPPMPTDVPAAKEVLKAFLDNGGKVVDVMHGGPIGENAARTAAAELGVQNKLFWTTPLSVNVPVLPGYAGPPPKVDPAAVRAAMEAKFAAFKVSKIDLVMVGAGGDSQTLIAVLNEMKKEGKVRYIGVHDLSPPPYPPGPAYARLEALMRNEKIDFVGTDYAVGWRGVEETILPLALEKKIGFIAYFPFDRARFFKRATEMPLPAWAAEFDAKTWAQFSLKYVLSHPAVIMARTGTTKAEHMLDNIAGGIGRLPNEAMRKRMAELVDSLPPTPAPTPPQPQPQQPGAQAAPPVVLATTILDRYVGEYTYAATAQTVTIRREGERLLMKVQGNAPEGPLAARSETRFQGPFGLVLEFQLDGQGKTTGVNVEQGPNRFSLPRK
jgi:aryl-alcohol dehydrogenase-like predicted oxidoreductase